MQHIESKEKKAAKVSISVVRSIPWNVCLSKRTQLPDVIYLFPQEFTDLSLVQLPNCLVTYCLFIYVAVYLPIYLFTYLRRGRDRAVSIATC
jgi:hypothetical protein